MASQHPLTTQQKRTSTAALVLAAVLVALGARAEAFAPTAAVVGTGPERTLAALADGRVRLATPDLAPLATVPAAGVSSLAAVDGALWVARESAVYQLDVAQPRWHRIAVFPDPVLQLLRHPEGGALALTGRAGEPVPENGRVWRLRRGAEPALVAGDAPKPSERPWRLAWTEVPGERRLAIATHKATRLAPFEHNCLFVYAWLEAGPVKRWLGSRLARPYHDMAHADLRGDGAWRLASVEETAAGGRGLCIYRPIGFGYEGEWRSGGVPELARVAALGDALIAWGDGPRLWQVLPAGEGYRLAPLQPAPPAIEALARLDEVRLVGWWDSAWRTVTLTEGDGA